MKNSQVKKSRHCNNWQRNAVAVAVASCFVITSPVYANPIGADVVSGTVSMAQQGNALNITNSPGAIINWQSFSIGASEATRFIQQSAASGVLNRVTGVDPSSILGALQSNGRVFLINPNGVLFGAGAQVDVAGLVVSTLNLSNADFLAGRYNFTAHAGAGGIDNQGSITALPGGQIYLVAPGINNSGAISSVNGDILLAAGNSVELVNANSPDMRVVISAPDNQAVNLGSIVANSGRVGIYAGLINHHGIVSADTATVGATGKVVFMASKDINLEPGSTVSSNVPQGGEITIQSGGITLASGKIEAKGSAGQGGTVKVLGNLVGLIDSASINVSGRNGGGTVLVGGDAHGANPGVPNAKAAFVGAATEIKAEALESGNGGKVVVWSNDSTRFYGAIKARGGSQSGNGGFVETSGHYLDVVGATVNTSASNGSTGTWLLDPYDVTIDGVTPTIAGTWSAANPNVWAPSATGSTILVSDIATNLVTADVTITTTNVAVGEAGNIAWNANATLDYDGIGTARTLSLKADRNIIFNGKIWDSTLGTADLLNVVFDSNATGGVGGGNIQMNTGSSIVSNGGNITFGGGLNPLTTAAVGSGTSGNDLYGIYLGGATLDAGAGAISLRGTGVAGTSRAYGVYITDASLLQTTGGAITLYGTGVAGTSRAYGVYITDASLLQTTGGAITLYGTGGAGTNSNSGVRLGTNMQITSLNGPILITGQGAGTGTNNYGVYMHNGATVISTGLATINVNGTGGSGTGSNNGVVLSSSTGSTAITSVNGAISIMGQGAGSGASNYGAYIHNGAAVTSTGNATVSVNGTGGAGTDDNYGVRLSSGMQINSINGGISITGQGAGSGVGNYGIIKSSTSGAITSTGLANITLNGTGAAGAEGISLAGVVNANHDLTLQGNALLLPASNYTFAAGNNLNLLANIGSAAQRFNYDLTLIADNDININDSIYLGNNTLMLAADADAGGTGSVFIQPAAFSSTPVVVDTQGGLNVSGVGFNVLGYYNPSSSYAAPVTVNVGGAFTANLTGEMRLEAGNAIPNVNWGDSDASVSLNVAGGDVSNNNFITVGSLTIQGGSASACGGDCWNLGNADAVLSTTKNFVITTTAGGVTVQGGNATAQGWSGSADAHANATLSAGNLRIDTAGTIQVQGGNAYALVTGSGANKATAEAKATISATDSLEITKGVSGLASSVQVYAGSASAYASNIGFAALVLPDVNAKASADATMSAGSLTLRAGSLNIRGGGAHAQAGGSYYSHSGSFFSGSAYNRSAEAQAKALVSVGTVSALTLGDGGLSINGGSGGSTGSLFTAIVSGSGGVNSALADRSALLDVTGSGDVSLTSAGGITIQGGSAQASASGSGTNTATEHADAAIQVVGLLHIADASGLTIQGGSSASTYIAGAGSNSATATVAAKLSAGSMTVNVSGNVLLDSGGALLANVGDIILAATSSNDIITLRANAYIDATGNVTLAAVGGNFVNNSGDATPITAARTLIYSTIPTSDTLNGMTADFKRYNCTYAAGCLTAGTTIPATGNGFLYSYAPALAVTADAQSKIYGAADPAFSYTVSGYEFGDDATTALSGALGRAAGENVGSYAINQGSFLSPLGYTINLTGNNLGITPASLSVIANALSKVYGSADPALTYTATGFQFSDTAGTALTGSLSRVAGEVIGLYAINQGSLVGANYTIAYTGNDLGITAAPAPAPVAPVDLVQPELNTVLNGTLEAEVLPILNGPLLAAAEQSGEEENPLEKKPTYTCQ